jgi:transposase-like protein
MRKVLLIWNDRTCLRSRRSGARSTFQVSKRSGSYPRPRVDAGGAGVVSHAGGVLLTAAIGRVGLDAALSAALTPWRRSHAVHDPAKVVLDLAVTLALGGDCLADIALLRSAPGVFGLVASDPTVSRTIDALAADGPAALAAIDTARAAARARAWELAGVHAPDHNVDAASPLVIDVDATLVAAHSEKEQAAPTFKRGFGFHPLWAFADQGQTGTGELNRPRRVRRLQSLRRMGSWVIVGGSTRGSFGSGRCAWSWSHGISTSRSGRRWSRSPRSWGSGRWRRCGSGSVRLRSTGGARAGTTTEESAELKRLKREVAELRRANEILKAAAGFFAAELDRPHRSS